MRSSSRIVSGQIDTNKENDKWGVITELFNVVEIAHKRLESVKILRTTEERDLRYKIPQPPKGRPLRSMEESIPLTPTDKKKKSSEIIKESRFSQSNLCSWIKQISQDCNRDCT